MLNKRPPVKLSTPQHVPLNMLEHPGLFRIKAVHRNIASNLRNTVDGDIAGARA